MLHYLAAVTTDTAPLDTMTISEIAIRFGETSLFILGALGILTGIFGIMRSLFSPQGGSLIIPMSFIFIGLVIASILGSDPNDDKTSATAEIIITLAIATIVAITLIIAILMYVRHTTTKIKKNGGQARS